MSIEKLDNDGLEYVCNSITHQNNLLNKINEIIEYLSTQEKLDNCEHKNTVITKEHDIFCEKCNKLIIKGRNEKEIDKAVEEWVFKDYISKKELSNWIEENKSRNYGTNTHSICAEELENKFNL